MINLSDTVKISIIVTVFSALMIMITCILYKLSKLREVIEEKTKTTSKESNSEGRPWRKDNLESARNSECSICKMEDKACNEASHTQRQQVPSETIADQDERVFTGILSFTIKYESGSLVLKHIIAEELLPWQYSSTSTTLVRVDFHAGETQDKRETDVQTGLYRVRYERELELKMNDTNLKHAHFVLSVWQTGDEESVYTSMIGEHTVTMDTLNITSASGQCVEVSKKLFKKPVHYLTSELGLNHDYFFNDFFRTTQPTDDRHVPTQGRKRANSWPKSAHESKMDERMTKKVDTEILLSLSYLPTAERLSVVVMKAKNVEMKFEETMTRNKTSMPNPFVKVCLIYAGRKIKRKKTSVRRNEKNPVYNESMIFDVPANFLHKIGFLVTIEHKNFETEQTSVLGRVVIGSPVQNTALRHWNQMIAFPRRPVAAWHKVFYLG